MSTSSKTKVSAASRSERLSKRISAFYVLTKPGIIYGNSLTVAAGFLFASDFGAIGIGLFGGLLAAILGSGLVIASGCVLNNYLDRSIDAKMERTKLRPLVTGEIGVTSALVFAAILGVAGIATLSAFTNLVTVYIGILGLYTYVVAYGYAKRRSHWGTLVGSIPGATPIAAGYTAVTGRFDLTAGMLFLTMVIWQLPHFYAISVFRRKDYAHAGLPVLGVVKPFAVTRRVIQMTVAAFTACLAALGLLGITGISATLLLLGVSSYWLHQAFKTSEHSDKGRQSWAKRVFGSSLLVVLVLSAVLSMNSLLP